MWKKRSESIYVISREAFCVICSEVSKMNIITTVLKLIGLFLLITITTENLISEDHTPTTEEYNFQYGYVASMEPYPLRRTKRWGK